MGISTVDVCDSDFVMRSINGTMADLNKKIDYALGLQLSRSTIRTFQDATPTLITPSINQTASFHVAIAEVRVKRPDDFVLHLLGPVPIGDALSKWNTRKLFGNLCEIAKWDQLEF